MVVSDHTATSAENLEPLPSRGSYTKDSPYSASTDEVFKKLRIQSGVVRRLCKEHSYYISECGSQLRRIEDMKSANACVHDLKQMSEVYGESKQMIPQVLMQLRGAREKLSALLDEVAVGTSGEVVDAARMRLKDACEVLQDDDFVPHVCGHRSDELSQDVSDSSSEDQVEAKLQEYKELIRSIHESSSARRRQVSLPAVSSRMRKEKPRVPTVRRRPQPKNNQVPTPQPVLSSRISFEVCGIGLVPSARPSVPLHRHSARSLGSVSSNSSRIPPPPQLVPLATESPRVLISASDTEVSDQLRTFLLDG